MQSQTEKELNEKLFDTMSKLFTANSEKRETEKEAKFKETLASLKRSFPGTLTMYPAYLNLKN